MGHMHYWRLLFVYWILQWHIYGRAFVLWTGKKPTIQCVVNLCNHVKYSISLSVCWPAATQGIYFYKQSPTIVEHIDNIKIGKLGFPECILHLSPLHNIMRRPLWAPGGHHGPRDHEPDLPDPFFLTYILSSVSFLSFLIYFLSDSYISLPFFFFSFLSPFHSRLPYFPVISFRIIFFLLYLFSHLFIISF